MILSNTSSVHWGKHTDMTTIGERMHKWKFSIALLLVIPRFVVLNSVLIVAWGLPEAINIWLNIYEPRHLGIFIEMW